MSRRNIHGSWDCKVLFEQKIILQKGKGSWNENAAKGYALDLRNCAQRLSEQSWVGVGYGVDWELGVPGIERIIIDLFKDIARQNCCMHIVIVKNSVAKYQLEKMLKIESNKYQLAFATCCEQACQILNDHGFQLKLDVLEDFLSEPY